MANFPAVVYTNSNAASGLVSAAAAASLDLSGLSPVAQLQSTVANLLQGDPTTTAIAAADVLSGTFGANKAGGADTGTYLFPGAVTVATNLTLTAGVVNQTGAANAVDWTISSGGVTGSGTTGTVAITETWNTSGAPTGISYAVTNTASSANSLLINLLAGVGGATSIFKVRVDGLVTAAGGIVATSGAFSSTLTSTAHTITSASASALAVGLNGATNPSFVVNNATALQVAGLSVTGAVTTGTVAVAVIDTGAGANLTLDAQGTGTLGIATVSTGLVTIGSSVTITTGKTLTVSGVTVTGLTAASVAAGTFPGAYTITGTTTFSVPFTTSIAQAASVGTTPGTQGTDFTFVSGQGGNTTIVTTGVGGKGGGWTYTTGAGGTAALAATAGTGGAGGDYAVTTGAGAVSAVTGSGTGTGGKGGAIAFTSGVGGATSVSTGVNLGGASGAITLTTAAGGASTNGSSNTGGASGAISITTGSGGTGATAAGASGAITLTTGAQVGSAGVGSIGLSPGGLALVACNWISATVGQVVIGGTYGAGVASMRYNGLTTAAVANQAGTLTNAPVVGNPSFWMPISIAGTIRYVPCW